MSDFAKKITIAMGDAIKSFDENRVMIQHTKRKNFSGPEGKKDNFKEWVEVPPVRVATEGLNIPNADFLETVTFAAPHSANLYLNHKFKLNNVDTLDPKDLQEELTTGMRAIDVAINKKVADLVAVWGSQTVIKAGAQIADYADIAPATSKMISEGASITSKKAMFLSPDAMINGLAKSLASLPNLDKGSMPESAYKEALVQRVAQMSMFQSAYTPSQLGHASTASLTMATSGQPQAHIPRGSTNDTEGNPTNVDNRTQVISLSAVTGLSPGCKFTIAGVNAISMESKKKLSHLRTFTVVSTPTSDTSLAANTIRIAPAIIPLSPTATAGTQDAEAQMFFSNVDAAPQTSAAITRLNPNDADANVYWEEDAVCINTAPVVGTEENLGGMILENMTTPDGFNFVLAKQGSINDLSTRWRLTTRIGVTMRDPLKAGSVIANQ